MTNENIILINNETPEQEIQASSAKDTFMSFVPLVLIFAVFYFFVIRPQVKKQKAQQELVQSAKKGDKVIVAGGLIGKIAKEKDGNIVVIEVAKNVTIEALKSSIVSIINDNVIPTESAKK
jgi:preprotein translocase subunit YajC